MRPPFRADHVSSLLRPAALKEARAAHDRGEMSDADLATCEDRAIIEVVRRQEALGLRLVTDGELRRAVWMTDFLAGLDGFEGYIAEHGVQFKGIESTRHAVRLVGRIGFSGHPMIGHFRFLAAHTRVMPKMTIPSPAITHFRSDRAEIARVYADIEEYFSDFSAVYRKVVRAFYDAGCRYLQIDDTAWAHLCSAEQRELIRSLGDDPAKLPASTRASSTICSR